MRELLLASWLATQTWGFDKVPDTDVVAYRVYWSGLGTAWCAGQRVEVVPDCWEETPGVWRCQADVPEPTFSPAFFLVTAVDGAGNESDTEHGTVSPTCP